MRRGTLPLAVRDDREMSDAPNVFLQWKGTDACMDFWCPCGAEWHFDGYFAKELTCGACGQTWELPHDLTPEPVTPTCPLTLVFGDPVIDPRAGAEFTVTWPRPVFAGAKAGDIVTVRDESHDCGRAIHADLLMVATAPSGEIILTLRTRDPA